MNKRARKTKWVRLKHLLPTLALLLAAIQGTQAETDPWYAAVEQADARVAAFEQAVNSGDKTALQRAALELQADPIAVKRFNQTSTDAFRAAHNEVTDGIKARTRELMRERMAKELGVKPEQITTFEATNPPKPGDPVKVGQDWDVTVRVDGRDVNHTVSGQYVNDSYFEAVHGSKAPSTDAANALAHRQAIEVTSYQHPEAYGGAQTEGGRIISDPKGSPTLRDPEQLGNTIDFKSRLPGNEAARLEAAGNFVEAQGFRMEQARQAAKQFDRQVAVRVAAMGGDVPEHVRRAMDIMRDIGDGKITPTQGQRLLAGMGETIDSVASKSAGLIESAQTLRPGGLGKADDVFVQNARNRLRQKGIDPDALRPLSPGTDLSDLRGGGQAVRSWAGTALRTLEVVGWAADGYEISSAAYEYLSLLLKVMDPNTPDEEAQAMFEKMAAAGMRITMYGGMAALFEAFPPTAALFGVFTITRLGLENTETGQRIDAAAMGLIDPEFLDDHYNAADRASCDLKEFLGMENICANLENSKRELLLSYLRAINEGKLVLKDPFTAKDLGKTVMAGVDASDMLMRVDERERLLAANERYNALFAALASMTAQCENLDLTRASTRTYFEDTTALSDALGASTALNIGTDSAIGDASYACDQLPKYAEAAKSGAERVMTAAAAARQAKEGSIAKLTACKTSADLDAANDLYRLGSSLTEDAAKNYSNARAQADTFEVLKARMPAGTARLNELGETLNGIDLRAQTLQNRLAVFQAKLAEITALETACSAQATTLQQEVDALTPILGDQVAGHRGEIQSIAAKAAAKEKGYSAGTAKTIESVMQRAREAQATLGAKRAEFASCDAVDLPVAELVAMNTAANTLPDISQWLAEIAALAGPCFAELNERAGGATADDDDRGDYEGFDADPGNIDPERAASVDTDSDEEGGAGPAGLDERAEGTGGQSGEVYDPGYTFDPIEEERRERERARDAERIANARDNARRGRDRDGDSIADEFGEAPDISRRPDDKNRDDNDRGNRDPRDGRGDKDDRRGGGNTQDDAQPQPDGDEDQENGDTTDTPGLPSQPGLPPSPDLPPSPELPPGPDLPDNPGLPPQGDGDRGRDEPKPPRPPEPEPAPPPPPVAPPADNNAQCQRLANQLMQQGPRISQLFGQFQAAARSEDEARAQRLACEVLATSDAMVSLIEEYEGARCPLESNISNLRSTLRTIRSGLQQNLAEQCGGGAASTSSFAGRWTSSGRCSGNSGDAAFRWTVSLSQSGQDISGTINFHRCPGGGRASYRVSGVAGSGEEATLRGSLVDSRGPLAETASRNITFRVSKNAAPSPNLAR